MASGFFVLNDSASNFYVTNETIYDIIKHISENDFCGNESIFILFIRILPIMGLNDCKVEY